MKRSSASCLLPSTVAVVFGAAPIVAICGEIDSHLPHWSSIPSEPFTRVLPKGSQLLLAESGEAANTFYFIYTGNQVQAFSPARDAPLWHEPAECRLLPRLLSLSATRAVLANRYEIFALNMRDGSRIWTFGQYPPDLTRVQFDHENAPSFRYLTATPDRVWAVRDNGQLNVVNTQTGDAIATHQLPNHTVNQPVICGDRMLFATRTGNGDRLCVVGFATDQIKHIADVDLGAGATSLMVSENKSVVAASIAGISAIDPIDSRVRWRWRSNQPIVAAGARVVGDAVLVATQDKIVVKLWLASGVEAWRTQPLAMQRSGAMRLEPAGDHFIAVGHGFADVLDSATGKIVATPWVADQPEDGTADQVTPDGCAITSQYLVLFASSQDDDNRSPVLRIYDHDNDVDVAVPAAMQSFKPFTEFTTMIALDDALIIQDGIRIRGWRVPGKKVRPTHSDR